ncbi:MAG: prephenate dehydrogenase/arogenate dehydrogenase family protein [Gammaproteobacteria bacterium]|nr:prephenate dehydrogenase/arogenate dehydrogenase family protein [Gammaproteobacteria bacterium]
MIDRLCIIGVGLIGGSLALALRRAGMVNEIVGSSRRSEHLHRAVELGVIDRFDLDAARAADGADVIVLGVPLGAMRTVCGQIKGALTEQTVLTDVGSSKASVVDAVHSALGMLPAGFVPAHPIAGTEKSGVEAAFAELFDGRRVVLTPLQSSSAQAIRSVHDMWSATGAIVEQTGVGHHDQVLAATSHLPHMLAFALVDSLARMGDHDEIFRFAAGGFRDFTRIASSDPVMWRDICVANRDALLDMMARFQEDFTVISDAIERGDGEALLKIFNRAKQARDRLKIG